MFTIQTLNKISKYGLDELDENYKIVDECKNPDAILLRSYKMHDLKLGNNVKAVGRAGAGVNNIPLDEYANNGVVVFNTPGANANAVKELVIAGLLLSSRKVFEGITWANTLKGQTDVDKLIEKGKGDFVGPEILGKKLGVIGLGAIGISVANSCSALGMDILAFDPYLSVNNAIKLHNVVKIENSIEAIIEKCDYVTLHIPLNNETKGMFNKTMFDKAKKGLKLLNFSRGELVNNDDVKVAIESGQVSKYVTDFPNGELLGIEGIIPIPHLGASSPESEDNCAKLAAMEIKEYLETGNITNSVNYPSLNLPFISKNRICVLYTKNNNTFADISSILSDDKIEITASQSGTKGDFSYAVFETNTNIPNGLIKVIEDVDNVLKVRVLCQQ